jgi:hypothetical protein
LYYGNFTNLSENGINTYEFAETNQSELLIKIFNKDNEALPGIDIKVNGSEAYLLGKLEPEEKYLLAYSGRKKSIKEITTCITFRIKWKEQVRRLI